MENSRSKQNPTHTLPQELMVEILLRLPVRSLLRFKSVCKSWFFLISHPQFAKSHFDLAATPSHRLLLLRQATGNVIRSIDAEASLSNANSAAVFLRFPPPSSPLPDQFCGSCRGFLLLEYDDDNLIVWNPSTGIHKRIPIPLGFEYDLLGFGYDASIDDYLVISMKFMPPDIIYSRWHAMIKLFSLKTNLWDCMYIDIKGPIEEDEWVDVAGSFWNGALHWLVYSGNERDGVIMVFDLVERSLSEIPLPPVLNDRPKYQLHGLRVIGESLGVWCSCYGTGEMWMMKEYKVPSSWTRSFDLSGDRFIIFSPIFLTKDNALVGSDLRCNRLEKLCGKTGHWLSEHFTYGKGPDFVCNMHLALYRETLLPLPISETTQDVQASGP